MVQVVVRLIGALLLLAAGYRAGFLYGEQAEYRNDQHWQNEVGDLLKWWHPMNLMVVWLDGPFQLIGPGLILLIGALTY